MKRLLCVMLVLSLCLTSVFALDITDPDSVTDMLNGFSEKIVMTIPTAVSVDNIWADAYIGQLIALPPHIAVGANFGSAFIKDNALLDGLGEMVGIEQLSMLPGAPVPATSVNARVGGFLLPFDVGIHVLPIQIDIPAGYPVSGNLSVNTWGVDFRYALLKQKLIIPAVSVGLGYDQVDTSAHLFLGDDPSQDIGISFAVNTHLLTGTAEVSWNLLFLKVFAGARAMQPVDPIVSSASVWFQGAMQGNPIHFETNATSLHVFGGVALRLLVLDTTIGASYDVTNGNYGASLSVRLQL